MKMAQVYLYLYTGILGVLNPLILNNRTIRIWS